MTTRNILVTGGAGHVGGSLAEALTDDPENRVVIVDNLGTGELGKLPRRNRERWRFIKADVNDYPSISAVMLSTRFDFVFHYAAVVGVARTLANPIAVLRDIDGIRNVLELSKNTGVSRVFYSSSSEVYGEPVEFPQHEHTTPLNSRLPYAVVKNVGEAFFRSYQRDYDLEYTIFRFFNTYGPRQSEDFVLSRFLRQAETGADITIYGDGQQTRTFCYVDDNVEVAMRCMREGHSRNDVLNVGSDQEITIRELAQRVLAATRSRSRIVHLPALKEGDMTRRCPDNRHMRAILGRGLLPLDEGIARVMAARRAAR